MGHHVDEKRRPNGCTDDDTLAGGNGDDALADETGSNLFILASGEGVDRITGFTPGDNNTGLADGVSVAGDTLRAACETLAILEGIDVTALRECDVAVVHRRYVARDAGNDASRRDLR